MANNKSFTIDHILHGHDNNKTSLVNGPTHNYLPSFLSGQQQQFQQHDPAALAAYWMGEAYYPTGSWPIPAAAIWLQQQQQQQQHHSSNMPVDLSSSTQRQAIAQHPSLFNNSNWGPATAAAAMTGCWTTNGSPAELLAYSHHGILFIIRPSPRLFHPTFVPSAPHISSLFIVAGILKMCCGDSPRQTITYTYIIKAINEHYLTVLCL